MLTITVPELELYDEGANKFVHKPSVVLDLEHSLVTLSKWEQIYEKPFLTDEPRTSKEILDYFRLMNRTPNIAPEVFDRLTEQNVLEINQYIDRKMTATWFNDSPNAPKSREVITSELIYYWMFSYSIPMECDEWHLNRLFTLLKVFGNKNAKPKKMSRAEIAAKQRDMNAQRRAKYGTSG